MNNKELRSLIVNDLKELLLLFDGMDEMVEIPSSVLSLASVKVDHISNRISELSLRKSVKSVDIEDDMMEDDDLSFDQLENEENGTKIEPLSLEAPLNEVEEFEDEVEDWSGEESDDDQEWDEVEDDEFDDQEWEVEDEEAEEDWNEDEEEGEDGSEGVGLDDEFGTEFAERIEDKVSEDALKVAERDKTDVAQMSASKRLESRFVVSLKKMGIVDRYRYGKELFNGDMSMLTHTIELLDEMDSLDDALSYIHSHFSWDEQNSAVSDFLVLLENRFS